MAKGPDRSPGPCRPTDARRPIQNGFYLPVFRTCSISWSGWKMQPVGCSGT